MGAARAISIVLILSIGHVIFNALAARTLILKSINAARLELLIDRWQKGEDKDMSPKAIASQESVFRWSPNLHIGTRFIYFTSSLDATSTSGEKFAILKKDNTVYISMKPGSSPEDQIRAVCAAFQIGKKSIRSVDDFIQILQSTGWDTSRVL